jgi:hypothetical protein
MFSRFQIRLVPVFEYHSFPDSIVTNERILPAGLSVLIFGTFYQLVLTWDALRHRRMIQIIGIVAYNLILLLYVMVQRTELLAAFKALQSRSVVSNDLVESINPLSLALPIVIAFGTSIQFFILWKLFQQYAWRLHRTMAIFSKVRVMHQTYQVCYTHRLSRPEFGH